MITELRAEEGTYCLPGTLRLPDVHLVQNKNEYPVRSGVFRHRLAQGHSTLGRLRILNPLLIKRTYGSTLRKGAGYTFESTRLVQICSELQPFHQGKWQILTCPLTVRQRSLCRLHTHSNSFHGIPISVKIECVAHSKRID